MVTEKEVTYEEEYISEDKFKRALDLPDNESLISVTFNSLTQEVLVVTRNKENS